MPTSTEDGDPPSSLDPLPVPCTVWYGPPGPESVERELSAFLGSHNGVAVLHWPRDTERAHYLAGRGIPRLWLTHSPVGTYTSPDGLDDWISPDASQEEIRSRLRELARRAARRREGAVVGVDGDYLELGTHRVALSVAESLLARALVEHFDEPVPDSVLSARLREPAEAPSNHLTSELIHLDRDLNTLGLEVVPVPSSSSHEVRRCRHG